MMNLKLLLSLAVTLLPVTAHFQINSPQWRANSFNKPYSQYTYPCAGVPTNLTTTNRTQWPLTGGSLSLDFHHPTTYVFINLGLGTNVSNFNISLNANSNILNETGNGTLCIERFTLPDGLDVRDGDFASLQVITVGERGSALYNCADIQFSSDAALLPASECSNSTGVSWDYISQESTSTSNLNATGTAAAGGSQTSTSAASGGLQGSGGIAGMIILVVWIVSLGL